MYVFKARSFFRSNKKAATPEKEVEASTPQPQPTTPGKKMRIKQKGAVSSSCQGSKRAAVCKKQLHARTSSTAAAVQEPLVIEPATDTVSHLERCMLELVDMNIMDEVYNIIVQSTEKTMPVTQAL